MMAGPAHRETEILLVPLRRTSDVRYKQLSDVPQFEVTIGTHGCSIGWEETGYRPGSAVRRVARRLRSSCKRCDTRVHPLKRVVRRAGAVRHRLYAATSTVA